MKSINSKYRRRDDGIERLTTQTLFDILEVPQRSRRAGACRRLAKLMTELGGPLCGSGGSRAAATWSSFAATAETLGSVIRLYAADYSFRVKR